MIGLWVWPRGCRDTELANFTRLFMCTGNPGEVQTNGVMSEFLSRVTVYSSCAGLQRKQVDQCEV